MAQLLEALGNKFDLTLLDTSSFLGVTDAAAVAPKTDGVLVVVARGRVREDDVRSVLGQLEDIHAQAVGLVVTRSARKAPSYRGDAERDAAAGLLHAVNE
jgi:polysaccharide biosynthesis transport protein